MAKRVSAEAHHWTSRSYQQLHSVMVRCAGTKLNSIRRSIRSKLRLCPTDVAAVSDGADAMAAVSVVAAVVAVRGVAAFAGSVAGVAAQAAVFWPD